MKENITVVGLGTGDEQQLTLGIWRKLQNAEALYLRTGQHPVVRLLQDEKIRFETFDALYEEKQQFGEVYEAIAEHLIEKAKKASGEIVYAVPGHPMVAEYTVQLLRERCASESIGLEVLGGESFLDQAFLRFGFDPIDGFQLLDGTALNSHSLQTNLHQLIGQVYDTYTASDVKLTLMDVYPDEYEVVVGHALGVKGEEQIHRIPLYELDRLEGYGNLSLVYVPLNQDERLRNRCFARLHEIVQILRSPEGCPWDREQTHASIRKNLIEETYEVLETIDDDDPDAMCEELGDLLLQVMLHAQMEEETGAFTVYDIIAGLNEKLVRRHPHVFGENRANNSEEALQNWQQMKDEEKRKKGIDPKQLSVLSGVPRDLPALMKAFKLQKKASKVGFDWDRPEEVIRKVEEELEEVRETLELGQDKRTEEVGDLLFAVANLARLLKVDPEEALTAANRKFTARFSYIEEQLRLNGREIEQTGLSEMEELSQQAKKVLTNHLHEKDFPKS